VVVAPVKEPRRVLVLALAVAVFGWVLDAHTDTVTGLERLGPKGSQEVRDARSYTSETGQAGAVTVVVRAKDLTSPRVISWMNRYQGRILARHGYSARKPCRSAELCPSLSLTNLFGATPAQNPAQVNRLLRALPRNFAQAVISRDGHTGTIAFLVRTMPISKQRKLIDDMRSQLDPPEGVDAELAGPPVLAAEARSDMQSSRRLLALGAVMAVFAILLMSLGSFRAALGPVIPVALATGWSGLVAFVSGVPLNALSAVLPALVAAVTAGLGLILSDRYRSDRARGLTPDSLLARTYELSRWPLLACAAVAIAGFAALVPSDIRMLRDFGIVGVADLVVVLAAAALVLPAALIWVEQAAPVALPRTLPLVARRARRESR